MTDYRISYGTNFRGTTNTGDVFTGESSDVISGGVIDLSRFDLFPPLFRIAMRFLMRLALLAGLSATRAGIWFCVLTMVMAILTR